MESSGSVLNSYLKIFLILWILLLFGFVVPCYAQPESLNAEIISWWSFDSDSENSVLDRIQQKNDSVYGNIEFVAGVSGRAIKLDGFRSYVKRDRNSISPEGGFTVESWVALASYPWSWAPVMDCSHKRKRGFFLGIGPEGQVKFKIAAGSIWYETTTLEQIPLRAWNLIAAVYEPNDKITVFINGEKAASTPIRGNFVPAPGWRGGSLTIGRNNYSQTWNEYQLTTEDAYFFLDGILDEIKVFGKAKTQSQLKNELSVFDKLPDPELSVRDQLPAGPIGSGSFGAFYTKLEYYKEWDDMWRVSDVPDVYVRFADSPVQFVFWRGTSFVPCWVNEKGIWYTNEWLETWGSDVVSCSEPIMDRHCRYSHVRIIENNDARVVVHWRYALNDAFYDFAAVSDDDRGEWCDEFHIIYPDQIGVRRMELHYSKPERKHDWVEQIVVLPPEKHPDDAVERSAISLMDMSGNTHDYSWHDADLQIKMPEPEGANISIVNMKSKYRPFIVVPPGPVDTVEGNWDSPFFRTYASKMAKGMRQDPAPSVYGWWNHWPVAQVPGDGRWVTKPDRPSHFTLTTFVQWNDLEKTDKTRTRIMLQGMTDKKAEEIIPLAKSWLEPPKMKILSKSYTGGEYDQSERAYIVEKKESGETSSLKFIIEASKDSPLLNPAIIVKNLQSRSSSLYIDGRRIKEGKNFRQGIRKNPLGNYLVIWVKVNKQKPVEIELAIKEQSAR